MSQERKMRIRPMLLVIASSLLLSGNVFSKPTASSALMKALKSPEAEILSGPVGVEIIFVQSRDGESFRKNVESLDTIYLITAQGTESLLIFEADKTNKPLYLLGYRFIPGGEVIGAELFFPNDLPDIDFQRASRKVAKLSGGRPIAKIGIVHTSAQGHPLEVSFDVQGENPDEPDMCPQYVYDVASDMAHDTGLVVKCFFDMNNA
jgi:hypothetical protein